MLIGMPTLIETENIEECALICKDLGLDFIELNMNMPSYVRENINIQKLKQISDKYGISYTFHLDENSNPWDFDNTISSAYIEALIQTIEIAKKLPANIINMHLSKGVYFTLPDRKIYLFEKYIDTYLQRTRELSNICRQAVDKSDIKICIENTNGFARFQRKALEILFENYCFYLTYDIGHGYSAGGLDEDFIMNISGKIAHMHFHDANHKSNHLPLGTGEIDLAKYLDLAEELKCSMVLETKTLEGLKQSVEWLNKNT